MERILYGKNRAKREDYLEEIGTFQGHRIYQFKAIDLTTTQRYMSYVAILKTLQSEQCRVAVANAFDLILEQVQIVNDITELRTQIPQLIGHARHFISYELYEKELFDMVNCMILIDDEPIDTFSDTHTSIKVELYDRSPEMKAFFLSYAIRFLASSRHTARDLSVESYLKEDYQRSKSIFLSMIFMGKESVYLKS